MREFGRRELVAGSLALGAAATAATGCSATDRGSQAEPTEPPIAKNRKLRGRIVVAPMQHAPKSARDALTAAYQKQHPDVEIVWRTKEFTDTNSYAIWLNTQLAAQPPEVDIVSGNQYAAFQGYVDFEEYRARTNPYTGKAWEDTYDFGLFDAADSHGRRTMISTEAVRLLWYYNVGLLESAGVEPPETWAQLVDLCSRSAISDITPVATNYEHVLQEWLPAIYFDQYHVDWVEHVRARPGDWNFDPATDGTFELDPKAPDLHQRYTFSPQRFFRAIRDRTIRFRTPRVAELVGKLAQVFPRYAGPEFFARIDPYPDFVQQQAAIMLDDSSALDRLRKDLEGLSPERARELGVDSDAVEAFDWDVLAFPSMSSSLVTSTVHAPEKPGGCQLSIVEKNSRQTELVMDFLMFWLSSTGYSAFLEAQVEAAEAAPDGMPLVSDVGYPEEVQSLLELAEPRGIASSAYGNFWVAGGGSRHQAELQTLFVEALRQELKPEQYAAQLDAYVRKNFGGLLEAADLTPADLDTPARRPAALEL